MAMFFTSALRMAAETCYQLAKDASLDVRIVRDEDGRISFAVNANRADVDHQWVAKLVETSKSLGAYESSSSISFADQYKDPVGYFVDGWCETEIANDDGEPFKVPMRDLPTWGRDWLWLHKAGQEGRATKRIVFHGLKGGVGRSTAIAMLAYMLARHGKKILVLDLDLESPGVSGLLLPPDSLPSHGIIDWIVEDGVGQGGLVIDDILSESPLSQNEVGTVLVAPAMGNQESEYLSKLGRAYREVSSNSGPDRFSDRLERLVESLERTIEPDYVFIDSRAGLHEIAAVAIARLADLSLLFAIDTSQNWIGYGELFKHWRSRPDVLRHVRDRLLVVRALAGESARQGFDKFLEKSFDLFSENVYDEVPPGVASSDVFSFDLKDMSAPHYPPVIYWDARFQEFDPLIPEERGGVGLKQIELAFGAFIDRVRSILDGNFE